MISLFFDFSAKVELLNLLELPVNFIRNLIVIFDDIVLKIFQLLNFFIGKADINRADAYLNVIKRADLLRCCKRRGFSWLALDDNCSRMVFHDDIHLLQDRMLQIDVCLEGVVVHIVFKLIYCWNIKDFEVVYHERVFVCVLSWIIHLNRLLEGL